MFDEAFRKQVESLMTLKASAEAAGVSRPYAHKFLAQLEERGIYRAIRVGPVVLVDKRFVDLVKPRVTTSSKPAGSGRGP